MHRDHSRTLLSAMLGAVATVAAALVIMGSVMTVAPQRADASAAITQKTGLPCAKCHTRPPALTEYGQQYKSGQAK